MLGSGLNHSQKATAEASVTAERKFAASLSPACAGASCARCDGPKMLEFVEEAFDRITVEELVEDRLAPSLRHWRNVEPSSTLCDIDPQRICIVCPVCVVG